MNPLKFREAVIERLREDRKRFARENERLCKKIRELEGRREVTQEELILSEKNNVEDAVRKLGLTATIDVCSAYREGYERGLRRAWERSGCTDDTISMLMQQEL